MIEYILEIVGILINGSYFEENLIYVKMLANCLE